MGVSDDRGTLCRCADVLLRILDMFPQRGTLREDIRPGLRLVPYRDSAEIAFTIDRDEVLIVGVFYGGQDYEIALQSAPEVL
jgi:toxin ParE1/3/4